MPRAFDAAFDEEPPRSYTREVPIEEPRIVAARRLLGVSREASLEEVRKSFRRLAVELHPDRYTRASEEERQLQARRFAMISAAYHLLVA